MDDKIWIHVSREVLNDVVRAADDGLSLLVEWKYRTIAEYEKTEANIKAVEVAIAEADAKSHCFKCKGEMDANERALCDSCEHWFCYEHIQSGVDCDLCDDCLNGLAEAEKEKPNADTD